MRRWFLLSAALTQRGTEIIDHDGYITGCIFAESNEECRKPYDGECGALCGDWSVEVQKVACSKINLLISKISNHLHIAKLNHCIRVCKSDMSVW